MTSKEALKELTCVSKWSKEKFDLIIKDLERLEKLEKALKIYQKYTKVIHDDSKDEFTDFEELWLLMLRSNWNYDDLTPEEFELLKELENE